MILLLGLALTAAGVTLRDMWPTSVGLTVTGTVFILLGVLVFTVAVARASQSDRAHVEARRREYEKLGVAEGHIPSEVTVPLRPSFGRWRIFGSPRH
jgi:hypothetical protein